MPLYKADVGSWNRGAGSLGEHTRLASVLVSLVAIFGQLSTVNNW